jgi:hypothetical protein
MVTAMGLDSVLQFRCDCLADIFCLCPPWRRRPSLSLTCCRLPVHPLPLPPCYAPPPPCALTNPAGPRPSWRLWRSPECRLDQLSFNCNFTGISFSLAKLVFIFSSNQILKLKPYAWKKSMAWIWLSLPSLDKTCGSVLCRFPSLSCHAIKTRHFKRQVDMSLPWLCIFCTIYHREDQRLHAASLGLHAASPQTLLYIGVTSIK